MECPDCGNEVDEAAIFCPHCRHQFREAEPEYDFSDEDVPVEEAAAHSSAIGYEESPEPEIPGRFTGKEIAFLKTQLITPAMILVVAVAFAGYFSMPQIQTLAVAVRDYTVPVGGAICLLAGIVIGGIFYGLMGLRLTRYREKKK